MPAIKWSVIDRWPTHPGLVQVNKYQYVFVYNWIYKFTPIIFSEGCQRDSGMRFTIESFVLHPFFMTVSNKHLKPNQSITKFTRN